MTFVQTMTVRADSADALAQLLEGWHRDQAGVAPGYRGSRLLADREQPGRYVVEVEFASFEEAQRNNDRAETQAWAQKLRAAAQGVPEYGNYEVSHSTT